MGRREQGMLSDEHSGLEANVEALATMDCEPGTWLEQKTEVVRVSLRKRCLSLASSEAKIGPVDNGHTSCEGGKLTFDVAVT